MLKIGITGGIGSGKSLVAGLFMQHGAALVDTDAIAHQLTGPGGAAIDAIRRAFGDGVIATDGRMDRAAMRARVFADPAQKKVLEGILHPMIQQEAQRQLAALAAAFPSAQAAPKVSSSAQASSPAAAAFSAPKAPSAQETPAALAASPYALVAVPLLVESGHWQQRVDRVLVVDCPEDVQVTRVMARSGLTAEQVRAIMASQATRAQRLAVADDVIDNGGSLEETAAQVAQLHRAYLEQAGQRA